MFPLLVKLSGGVQEYNADCVLLSTKTCCAIMIIVEAERVSVDCQLFKSDQPALRSAIAIFQHVEKDPDQ